MTTNRVKPAPHAEDLNYWRTGSSSPDTWIAKARREIALAGGKVGSELFGQDDTGRAAYMLEFSFDGERFRAIWPVLHSSTNNQEAARIQAATMLYHDIKAKCVAAKVHGARAAFIQYLLLPDGRQVGQASAPELADRWPKLLTGG